MSFRTFTATIIAENGKVLPASKLLPANFYSHTFVNFTEELIAGLLNDQCRNGTIHISSKADAVAITVTGDLEHCRDVIAEKITLHLGVQVLPSQK